MKTILVPYDFSKNAGTALRYAIRLCTLTGSSLIVFHCSHLSPYLLAEAAVSKERMDQLEKEDEVFKLEKLRAQVNKAYKYLGIKKIPSSTKILVSADVLVVDSIISTAEKCQAGLIISGTHGATGLNRFIFGSVTAILIAKSAIPVLAVPEKYKFKKIKNIVFASDLENLEQELNTLVPIARTAKANIKVLYLDYGIDAGHKHIHAALDCIARSGYKNIQMTRHKGVIDYSLIKQLNKYLSTHNYQWLVMFTKERRFWDKLFFGGKTESMSYSIKIPLLSFKRN